MSRTVISHLDGQVVEEEIHLTLLELCQACNTSEDVIAAWVFEGVLQPVGRQPQDWRFGGSSLRRARLAQDLMQHLELNTPGVALTLELLERIEALQAQLKRTSHS